MVSFSPLDSNTNLNHFHILSFILYLLPQRQSISSNITTFSFESPRKMSGHCNLYSILDTSPTYWIWMDWSKYDQLVSNKRYGTFNSKGSVLTLHIPCSRFQYEKVISSLEKAIRFDGLYSVFIFEMQNQNSLEELTFIIRGIQYKCFMCLDDLGFSQELDIITKLDSKLAHQLIQEGNKRNTWIVDEKKENKPHLSWTNISDMLQ